MKIEEHLLVSILEQAEASDTSSYTAPDVKSALHVALLEDWGYVKARVNEDENGKVTGAQIIRITSQGYDALARFRGKTKSGQEQVRQTDENKRERLLGEAKSTRTSEGKQYETRLFALASGGIVLTFHVAQFCHGAQLSLEGLMPAIAAFGIALVVQLLSHCTSQFAYDCMIAWLTGASGNNAMLWNRLTRIANVVAGGALLIGIVLFVVKTSTLVSVLQPR